MSKQRRWTKQEEEYLIARWEAGAKAKEIAKELNRTVSSVRSKRLRLPIKEVGYQITRHPNYKPIGTIQVTRRNKTPYKKIKVSDTEWEWLHRYIWEQHYGPLQDDEVILFLDKDTLNTSIDNLYKADKGLVMALNRTGRRYCHPEMTKSGIGLTKLEGKINKMEEKANARD